MGKRREDRGDLDGFVVSAGRRRRLSRPEQPGLVPAANAMVEHARYAAQSLMGKELGLVRWARKYGTTLAAVLSLVGGKRVPKRPVPPSRKHEPPYPEWWVPPAVADAWHVVSYWVTTRNPGQVGNLAWRAAQRAATDPDVPAALRSAHALGGVDGLWDFLDPEGLLPGRMPPRKQNPIEFLVDPNVPAGTVFVVNRLGPEP